MCGAWRMRSASSSALQPEPEQKHRPEVTPPVDDRPRARVRSSLTVRDANRNFLPAIAAKQRLGKEIRFDLVATQPGLVQVDPRVVQDPQPISLVAARGVCDAPADEDREERGEDLDQEQPVPRD